MFEVYGLEIVFFFFWFAIFFGGGCKKTEIYSFFDFTTTNNWISYTKKILLEPIIKFKIVLIVQKWPMKKAVSILES